MSLYETLGMYIQYLYMHLYIWLRACAGVIAFTSMLLHVSFPQPMSGCTVTRLVRMEGLWMQKHVCVTAQVTSVGQVVKVSALSECKHAAINV